MNYKRAEILIIFSEPVPRIESLRGIGGCVVAVGFLKLGRSGPYAFA